MVCSIINIIIEFYVCHIDGKTNGRRRMHDYTHTQFSHFFCSWWDGCLCDVFLLVLSCIIIVVLRIKINPTINLAYLYFVPKNMMIYTYILLYIKTIHCIIMVNTFLCTTYRGFSWFFCFIIYYYYYYQVYNIMQMIIESNNYYSYLKIYVCL